MRSLFLLTTVLLLACGPTLRAGDDPEVSLQVEPSTAAPGDTVTLLLRNGSAQEVGYNLCTSAMERSVSGDWQPIPSDRVCTMEIRTLEPGAEARFPMPIAAGIPAGEYRFRTTIDRLDVGDRGMVTSNTLEVRG